MCVYDVLAVGGGLYCGTTRVLRTQMVTASRRTINLHLTASAN